MVYDINIRDKMAESGITNHGRYFGENLQFFFSQPEENFQTLLSYFRGLHNLVRISGPDDGLSDLGLRALDEACGSEFLAKFVVAYLNFDLSPDLNLLELVVNLCEDVSVCPNSCHFLKFLSYDLLPSLHFTLENLCKAHDAALNENEDKSLIQRQINVILQILYNSVCESSVSVEYLVEQALSQIIRIFT